MQHDQMQEVPGSNAAVLAEAGFQYQESDLAPWQRDPERTGPLTRADKQERKAHEERRVHATLALISCMAGQQATIGRQAGANRHLGDTLHEVKGRAADAARAEVLRNPSLERLYQILGTLCADSGVRPGRTDLSGADREVTISARSCGVPVVLTVHPDGGRAQIGKGETVGAAWTGSLPSDAVYEGLAPALQAMVADAVANPDRIDVLVDAIMALAGDDPGALRAAMALVTFQLGAAV